MGLKELSFALKQTHKKYKTQRKPEPNNVMDSIEADRQYTLAGEKGNLSLIYELLLFKLNRLIPRNDQFNGLDIACGSGQLICKIANDFKNVNFTAFDYSSEMLELAEETKNKYGCSNISFKKADMLNLESEFEEKSFDIITWNFAMHHTDSSEEVIEIINSALKLLKEDGVLFIFDMERAKTNEIAFGLSKLHSLEFGIEHFIDTYNSYLAAYSFDEVEKILQASNWKNYRHIHPVIGNFIQIIYTKKTEINFKRKPNFNNLNYNSKRFKSNYYMLKSVFKDL